MAAPVSTPFHFAQATFSCLCLIFLSKNGAHVSILPESLLGPTQHASQPHAQEKSPQSLSSPFPDFLRWLGFEPTILGTYSVCLAENWQEISVNPSWLQDPSGEYCNKSIQAA